MSELRDAPLRELLVAADDYLERRSGGEQADPKGEAAWTEFRRRIQLLALRLAFPLDADDVSQRVLLRFQSRKKLKAALGSANPTAYLFQAVRNEARDLSRQQDEDDRKRAAAAPAMWRNPLEEAGSGLDSGEELRHAIGRLPAADQELLRMRFWHDLNISQIASRLGITYSATAVRLFRAIRRLRGEVSGGGVP